MTANATHVEPLERRLLLARVGLDLNFGDAGYAVLDLHVFRLTPVADGKILASGYEVVNFVNVPRTVRLNADGSVDPTFVVPAPPEPGAGPSVVSGERMITASQIGGSGAPIFLALRATRLDD